MRVERQVEWLRSRAAVLWLAASLVACFVTGRLSPEGCESIAFEGEGISLPADLPWMPRTYAQRLFYARLLEVLGVVKPPLFGLTLVLLVGVLWSRVVRPARVTLALLVVPVLATALEVGVRTFFSLVYPAIPEGEREGLYFLFFHVREGVRPAMTVTSWLIALGLVALLVRALWTAWRGTPTEGRAS